MAQFPQPESYTAIGTIVRAKGVKGQMVVGLLYPTVKLSFEVVYILQHQTYVPCRVTFWQADGNYAMLALEMVNDRTEALLLQHERLFLPTDLLKKSLVNSDYALVDYLVTDHNLGLLGPVTHVEKKPWQVLLHIDYQGKKLLIPLHNAFISQVDHTDKAITTKLPSDYLATFGHQ